MSQRKITWKIESINTFILQRKQDLEKISQVSNKLEKEE